MVVPSAPNAIRSSIDAALQPSRIQLQIVAEVGAVQTMLTLISFGTSAFFLGTDLGNPEVISLVGWATALVGAISTVDLLLHRCFSTAR